MFCRYCGNPIDDHAAFCGKCGGSIKVPTQTVSIAPVPSFLQELKHSIALLALAILYFIWERFLPSASDPLNSPSNMFDSYVLNYITLYTRAFFWAALCYCAANRSRRITALVILAYLLFHIFWPNLYPEQSFEIVWKSSYLTFEYLVSLLIPFVVWGLVRIVCNLTKSVKHRFIVNILFTAVIVGIIFLYHLPISQLMCREMDNAGYSYRYIWISSQTAFNTIIASLVIGLGYRKYEKEKLCPKEEKQT